MVSIVRFGLLGRLMVEHNGLRLVVSGPKQRVLLAALLARPNQVVPAMELVDIMWNGNPPASAIATLRSHVKRLRHCLGQLGPERITTSPSGYRIRIDDAAELDVAAFTDGIHRGRAGMLDHDWPTGVAELGGALDLWRGAPLSDIDADHVRTVIAPDLRRIRLQAEEWYAEALLEVGRPEAVVRRLRPLAAEHRLREHLHELLIVALYRCGEPTLALTAYRSVRAALVAELGVEPGPGLRGAVERLALEPAAGRALAMLI